VRSRCLALVYAGRIEEARAVTPDILATNDEDHPLALAGALVGFGLAFFDTDPAIGAAATGLRARAEAAAGSPLEAARTYRETMVTLYDAGNRFAAVTAYAVLGSLLHDLGRDEAAAISFGFADGLATVIAIYPEIVAVRDEVRAALGDETYEELARQGATMRYPELHRFGLEQIEQLERALA
jgi:hypothetical protein